MRKYNVVLFIFILVAIIFNITVFNCNIKAYEGNRFKYIGQGTKEDPFIIDSFSRLEKIGTKGYPLDAHYKLVNDIDASITKSKDYNNGKGWDPIGEVNDLNKGLWNGFQGVFDGQGYAIRNLYINRQEDAVALFSVLDGGVIRDLSLVKVDITGRNKVGGLVGINDHGTITNSRAITRGTVKGKIYVGGLIGYNNGDIEGSYTGNCVQGYQAGGLVGYNESGTIKNSYVNGDIEGKYYSIGGLVGYNEKGRIENCYTITRVEGMKRVGGLVGSNLGILSESEVIGYTKGNISVGGLVGENQGIIEKSYVSGEIKGLGQVGGLVGLNYKIIKDSYTTRLCSIQAEQVLGGLVADNFGLIEKCYTDSSLKGIKFSGGLVASNSGTILNSSASANVVGKEGIAGLAVYNKGIIENSYSRSTIQGNNAVAGLVLINDRMIKNTYHTGEINTLSSKTCGLVFLNNGEVENSFYSKSSAVYSDGGIGFKASQMEQEFIFDNWDFNEIWAIKNGKSYPYLQWQSVANKVFDFIIEQEGKEIKVINNEVTLKKKPFKIKVFFKDEVGIYIHASLKAELYNKLKDNPVFNRLTVCGGGSIAVYDDSTTLYLTKNTYKSLQKFDLPEYYYLFYEEGRTRFDDIIKTDDQLIGEKTFDTICILDIDSPENLTKPIKEFSQNVFYMYFLTNDKERYNFLKVNFIPGKSRSTEY